MPPPSGPACSGYCRTADGSLVAFSIMMNRVNDVLAARRLEDRMVQAIAGYDA
jgi:D-alanyl-D-alanine carboxypeptidase